MLHTLVTGNPPPVSVVRCIEDRYQPLTQLRPEGFSLALLNAIDRSLAMKPQERPQSIEELAALIELPVSKVEQLVTAVTRISEPEQDFVAEPIVVQEQVVVAVNPAAGAAEMVSPHAARKLSKPLVVLAGLAVLAVIALIVVLNPGEKPVIEHPAVAGGTESAAPDASAKPQTLPASTPMLATVYLKLTSGETVLLNGTPIDVKPNNSGYASLNLAAGSYKIEVHSGTAVHSQQLEINKAGTWLINPGL